MPPNDKLRRRADEKSMDLRSAMNTQRRNQRIKLVLWVIVIAAAVKYVPWRSIANRALSHMDVELSDADAGVR